MNSFVLALIVALIGSAPFLLTKRLSGFAVTAAIATVVCWLITYFGLPSSVGPLWGGFGVMVFILWIIVAIIDGAMEEKVTPAIVPALLGLVAFMGVGCNGCEMFRSQSYANLLGNVEQREWTQDVQPKDPGNVRLVPTDLARFLANKQLGEASTAIGSQYHVVNSLMTLQSVGGHLWYVVPLDFNGFWVWKSTHKVPGYVMVSATDPRREPVVKLEESFRYTPGACFGENLKRLLRSGGYRDVSLSDVSLEIDEEGKAWWIVTTAEPTISFFGYRATGVAQVDPESGNITFYPIGSVPEWVDRVVPQGFVSDYIRYRGSFHLGYWNTWFERQEMTEPESPTINYGSDHHPYWVTSVTSTHEGDESMVGLYYTSARTGQSVYYKAVGGTEAAVLTAVDNAVVYRHWHGAEPVLYNLHGLMASFVPLLGENGTFQGVAIVRVDNLAVAVGTDELSALREFQQLLSATGQQVPPDAMFDSDIAQGSIERFASEVRGGEMIYYVKLRGRPVLFTGASALSSELVLSRDGDSASIAYVAGDQDVIPMLSFDNLNVELRQSQSQRELSAQTGTTLEAERQDRETKTAKEAVKQLSDDEIRALMKEKRQKK